MEQIPGGGMGIGPNHPQCPPVIVLSIPPQKADEGPARVGWMIHDKRLEIASLNEDQAQPNNMIEFCGAMLRPGAVANFLFCYQAGLAAFSHPK